MLCVTHGAILLGVIHIIAGSPVEEVLLDTLGLALIAAKYLGHAVRASPTNR
jgi:hypothetical protein